MKGQSGSSFYSEVLVKKVAGVESSDAADDDEGPDKKPEPPARAANCCSLLS